MNDNKKNAAQFCKFINQGLVYNNNTVDFTVAPCCYYSEKSVLDLKQDIHTQIQNSRERWNRDNWEKTCRICLDHEKAGQASYRQASHDMISQDSNKIKMLTVAVNKQCNLACASCGSHSSSLWFHQNRKHGIQDSPRIVDLHKEDKQGMVVEKFLSVFEFDFLSDVSYIKFGGGEPLMSTIHEKILRAIKNPAEVSLHYTSNFSIAPSPKVYDLWSKFKLVKWIASLDGIGEQFEILRWPYKWANLGKFIAKVKIRAPHNVMFGVEHTINPLNVWYIDKFRDWFNREFATNQFGDANDFNIHVCTGSMSLDQTPLQLREVIEDKLGQQDVVVQLLKQNTYVGSHRELTTWLDSLDVQRKTNWRKTFQEVSGYFD